MVNKTRGDSSTTLYIMVCNDSASAGKREKLNTITEYMNGTRGTITSPNYPEDYPANINYTWVLRMGKIKTHVVFTIQELDLSRMIPCADYVKIRRTDPCCLTVFKKCGMYIGDVSVKGREFQFSMVTDKKFSGKGFKLLWKATGTIKIKTNTDPRQPIKKDTVTRNTIIKTTTSKEKDNSTNNWQSLGHTELSSTKRSPTPIELLLSTPLTYGIGFLSLFGVIIILLVVILSIVCKQRRRNRQSKHIYFCAPSDKSSMQTSIDQEPVQKRITASYKQKNGNSIVHGEPAENDYMELSDVETRQSIIYVNQI
ncbi:uncharacterized protein LOC111137175 isoform X1 [Crassostrea virginica]